MVPAPKSRVPKGRIVAEPPEIPSPTRPNNLKDKSNESGSPVPKPNKVEFSRTPSQKTSAGQYDSPPQPTFYIRKASTFANGEDDEPSVIKRGPTPEIREHLKHLGPSNLASRPRQTRYQSVKIKRGSTSPERARQTSGHRSPDSKRRASETTSLMGGSNTPKVPNAGKGARGGVRALKASYGTMGDRGARSSPNADVVRENTPETVNRAVSAQSEDFLKATLKQENENTNGKKSPQQQSGTTSPTADDREPLHPNQPFRLHGPTRSGSITEQIVDSNGIQKVILQTGSHSSFEDENENRRLNGNTEFAETEPRGRKADKEPVTSGTSYHYPEAESQISKKKRRKKQKQKSKSKKAAGDRAAHDESQSLLDK